MVVYLFIFILLLLLFVSFRVNRLRLRPSVALILPMLISACVVCFLQDFFLYDLSLFAVGILSFMIFFYMLGEFAVMTTEVNIKKNKSIYELYPKLAFKRFALVLIVINFVLHYKYIRDVGVAFGATDLLSSYAANRLNTLEQNEIGFSRLDPPGYLTIISFLSAAAEIICLHILLLDKLKLLKKFDKYLLSTVVIYFLTLFFNSGRAAFVPVFTHLVYLVLRFSDKSLLLLIKSHKLIFSVVSFVLITLFLLLGNLREKSAMTGNFKTEVNGSLMAAMYVGGPLVGFDIYANRGLPPYDFQGLTRNDYIGQNTFKGVYDVLRKIGIDTKRPVPHEEKFYLKVVEANVYTGFCHFIRDFGLYGALLFLFIMGAVIGHFDSLIKKSKIRNDSIIGYFTMSWIYFSLISMFYTNEFYFLFSVDYIIFRVFFIYIFMRLGVRRIKVN